MPVTKSQFIVALESQDINKLHQLVDALGEHVLGFQLPTDFVLSQFAQLGTGNNPEAKLRNLRSLLTKLKGRMLLDLKLDDDPRITRGVMEAIAAFEPWAITVHGSSGHKSLEQVVQYQPGIKTLVVPLLTSISENEVRGNYGFTAGELVETFTALAVKIGAEGIYCSSLEVDSLKKSAAFKDLLFVCTGIRPLWAPVIDEEESMTPRDAQEAGADILVIGAPITEHVSPQLAMRWAMAELG